MCVLLLTGWNGCFVGERGGRMGSKGVGWGKRGWGVKSVCAFRPQIPPDQNSRAKTNR